MGDETETRRRAPRMNKHQKAVLIELLERNPELVQTQLNASYTFKDQQNDWDQITLRLNKLGPKRDATKWKKAWQDMKSEAKAAAGRLAVSTKATGGGEGLSFHLLSPTKQRIIAISGGRALVEGHYFVDEFGVGEDEEEEYEYVGVENENTLHNEIKDDNIDRALQQIPSSSAVNPLIKVNTPQVTPTRVVKKTPVSKSNLQISKALPSAVPRKQENLMVNTPKVTTSHVVKKILVSQSNLQISRTPAPTVPSKQGLEEKNKKIPPKCINEQILELHSREIELLERNAIANEAIANTFRELTNFILKKK